jgi:hypothetical protein
VSLDIGLFSKTGARLGWLNDASGINAIWRYNRRGNLTLTVPGDHIRAEQLVSPGARVCLAYVPEGGTTTFYLSGRVDTVQAQGPARGSTLVVTVLQDWPDNILAWPVPANALTNQNVEYYRATGAAETVIKNIITANAITRLGEPWTVAASLGRGNSVTVAARYTPISEVLEGMLDPGVGLSVIRYPGDATNSVDVYVPVDRTARVMSEASSAITQWSMTMGGPTLTRAVVGMDGEGTARAMTATISTVFGDHTAVENAYGMILEGFVDARDVASTPEGQARGEVAVTEGSPTISITATLAETPFWRVGNTLNLGDIVTVEPLPGLVSVERVTEIELSYTTENGLNVTPRIGDANESEPTRLLADKMARIAKAVRQLRAR